VIRGWPFYEFKFLVTTWTRSWSICRDIADIAEVEEVVEPAFADGEDSDVFELIFWMKPGGELKLVFINALIGQH
jgi:hypothetical protein